MCFRSNQTLRANLPGWGVHHTVFFFWYLLGSACASLVLLKSVLQVPTLDFFNPVLLHRSCLLPSPPPVVPKACFFCARFCILKPQPSSGPGTYKTLLPSKASGFPCQHRTRSVFSFRKFSLCTPLFFQENCCHALTLDQSETRIILKNRRHTQRMKHATQSQQSLKVSQMHFQVSQISTQSDPTLEFQVGCHFENVFKWLAIFLKRVTTALAQKRLSNGQLGWGTPTKWP